MEAAQAVRDASHGAGSLVPSLPIGAEWAQRAQNNAAGTGGVRAGQEAREFS